MATPMLTTIDNPYNPHDDYDKWYQWDTQHGYHTSAYLARLIDFDVELEMNQEENDLLVRTMWEIVMMDDSNTYVLV